MKTKKIDKEIDNKINELIIKFLEEEKDYNDLTKLINCNVKKAKSLIYGIKKTLRLTKKEFLEIEFLENTCYGSYIEIKNKNYALYSNDEDLRRTIDEDYLPDLKDKYSEIFCNADEHETMIRMFESSKIDIEIYDYCTYYEDYHNDDKYWDDDDNICNYDLFLVNTEKMLMKKNIVLM